MAVAVVDVQVNSQAAVRNLQQINTASSAATASIGALGRAMGGLLGAFSAIAALRFVVVKTAELETQTRSIETLTGSAEKAKQIIQELQQLGAVTPFTSTELIDSAKRLQAFGVQAKDVVATTRRLADVAGATGAELQGLVTAYGQVQAKGKLQGEELLQFQERGIALQGELRKMYGMTGEEFQKALSKGRISAEAVEVAIVRLTEKGGKYANGAVAQSTTLAGKFSTLADNVENLAKTIGTRLNPILKSTLDLAIQAVDSINQAMAAGSVGIGQKQAFQRRAESIVSAQAGFMPGGPFGAGQISIQYGGKTYKGNAAEVTSAITNDLINDEVKRQLGKTRAAQRGGAKLPAKTTPPPLLAGTEKADKGLRPDIRTLISQQAEDQLNLTKAQNDYQKQLDVNAAQLKNLSDIDVERIKHAYEIKNAQAEIMAIEQTMAQWKDNRAAIEAKYLRELGEKNQNASGRKYAAEKFVFEMQRKQNEMNIRKIELQTLELQQRGQIVGLTKKQQEDDKKTLQSQQDKLQQLKDEQALLNARLAGNEAEVMLRQQLRDITKEMTPDQIAQAEGLVKGNEALKQQLTVAEKMKGIYSGIAETIGQGMTSAFDALIRGSDDWGKSLQQIASGVLTDIANQLIRIFIIEQAVNAIKDFLTPFSYGKTPLGAGGGIKGGLGTLGPNYGIPQRAMGGSVTAGQPYLVGERGPELFMPGRSGGIAPTGSFGGGANIVVNVDASGTSVQGNQPDGQALGRAIAAAVQQELIKQKRPGGLLV